MVILIDTREKAPWSFPPHILCEVGTISTGDYAIKGDEKKFAIERKSAEDFVGTVSIGWPRFCREIKRMEENLFPAKIIIVETDFETFCYRLGQGMIIPPDHEHTRCTAQFLMKRIAQLTMRGVSVIFAGNADYASAIALRIFYERDEKLKEVNNGNHSYDGADAKGKTGK